MTSGAHGCTAWAVTGSCGAPARLYPAGWRCNEHTPARAAGRDGPPAIPPPPTGTASTERSPYMLTAALEAAAYGWHVFPLRPGTKRPAFPEPRRSPLRPGRPAVPGRAHRMGTAGHHRPGPHPPRLDGRPLQYRDCLRAVPPDRHRPRHAQAHRLPAIRMGPARDRRRQRRTRRALPDGRPALPRGHLDRAHPERGNAPVLHRPGRRPGPAQHPRGKSAAWGGSSTPAPEAGTSSEPGALSTVAPTRSRAASHRPRCPGGWPSGYGPPRCPRSGR